MITVNFRKAYFDGKDCKTEFTVDVATYDMPTFPYSVGDYVELDDGPTEYITEFIGDYNFNSGRIIDIRWKITDSDLPTAYVILNTMGI